MGNEQKRATVAGNAKQIVGLKAQLDSIQNLLQTLVTDSTPPGGGHVEGVSTTRADMRTPSRATPVQGFEELARQREGLGAKAGRLRMANTDLAHDELDDPWRIIRGRRPAPVRMQELSDDEEIQKRVSQLLAANWNPLEQRDTGKRSFAHYHIVRGARKLKTGLGELSLPEYIFGMSQVAKTHEGLIKDAMIRHIEAISEDEIT